MVSDGCPPVVPQRLLWSKFVPGTGDQEIVALKSVEVTVETDDDSTSETTVQDTYIMVFNLDGEVLLDETEVGSSIRLNMVGRDLGDADGP